MVALYRLRAVESDTGVERLGFLSCADDPDTAATRWAADYYGDEGATWFKPAGAGRYIAGRCYDDGFREPGTCVISVELYDDARSPSRK